eukprot:scaffold223757_cov19-Prasinocladus_malaysianus.AAC.2
MTTIISQGEKNFIRETGRPTPVLKQSGLCCVRYEKELLQHAEKVKALNAAEAEKEAMRKELGDVKQVRLDAVFCNMATALYSKRGMNGLGKLSGLLFSKAVAWRKCQSHE